jgi:hypothetical protein
MFGGHKMVLDTIGRIVEKIKHISFWDRPNTHI